MHMWGEVSVSSGRCIPQRWSVNSKPTSITPLWCKAHASFTEATTLMYPHYTSMWKTTIVTASQVGDRLVRMDYCYFHQSATFNMCVFLFLLLISQKINVTIIFSVKFSFRNIFYLNFEKNGLLLFSQWTLQLYLSSTMEFMDC